MVYKKYVSTESIFYEEGCLKLKVPFFRNMDYKKIRIHRIDFYERGLFRFFQLHWDVDTDDYVKKV